MMFDSIPYEPILPVWAMLGGWAGIVLLFWGILSWRLWSSVGLVFAGIVSATFWAFGSLMAGGSLGIAVGGALWISTMSFAMFVVFARKSASDA